MHAGSGSVHRAAWPVVDPYVEAATGASPELLTWAGKAVEQLRKIKSEAKVSMKTPILSVALSAASEGVEAIHAALGDIAQAGRVVGKVRLGGQARRGIRRRRHARNRGRRRSQRAR